MEQELKSIPILLDYIDLDGIEVTKVFHIKPTTVKSNDRFHTLGKKLKTYDMNFTLIIPDHYHKALKGKSIGQGSITESFSKRERNYDENFSKTINRDTISALTTAYLQIHLDYYWLLNIEKLELKKSIFYTFDNKVGESKSSWNGNRFGEFSDLNFGFMIGYQTEYKGNKLYYNIEKKLLNSTYDKEYINYKSIDWTQEREDFFTSIQNSYVGLVDKLNKFDESLNEETINNLIQSTTKLLG